MAASKPTLVSIFSGAGGLDIGLEQAGFRTVAAAECDPDCIATLAGNRGKSGYLADTNILPNRVEDLDAADLRPVGVARNWVPDLLAGGPPCQPFSSSGKGESIRDPRGQLFHEFVRLAGELRPRLVLFENVRGLATAKGPKGEPGEVLFLVKEAFESLGYATTFALLNAADFGVPQRRVRLFMLGSRWTPLPDFPPPTHSEHPETTLFDQLEPWVSLGEFLRSFPPPRPDEVVRPTAALAEQLAKLPDGTGLRSAGAREATRPGGHWGYRQGTFVADPNLPARTITASASQDWVRESDRSLRRLTARECAALQGFPRDWEFVGNTASRFRQIGNAVPPKFGEVLGRVLLEALNGSRNVKPSSAPLPGAITAAIIYTKKENQRNGESRLRVRQLQESGIARRSTLKGAGHRLTDPSNAVPE